MKILHQYLIQSLEKEVLSKFITFPLAEYRELTIMIANIRGYLDYLDKYPPETAFNTLNLYFLRRVQPILERGGTIGNIFEDTTALFGILPTTDSVTKLVVNTAFSMIEVAKEIREFQQANNLPILSIGVGITSGAIVLSTVYYS